MQSAPREQYCVSHVSRIPHVFSLLNVCSLPPTCAVCPTCAVWPTWAVCSTCAGCIIDLLATSRVSNYSSWDAQFAWVQFFGRCILPQQDHTHARHIAIPNIYSHTSYVNGQYSTFSYHSFAYSSTYIESLQHSTATTMYISVGHFQDIWDSMVPAFSKINTKLFSMFSVIFALREFQFINCPEWGQLESEVTTDEPTRHLAVGFGQPLRWQLYFSSKDTGTVLTNHNCCLVKFSCRYS